MARHGASGPNLFVPLVRVGVPAPRAHPSACSGAEVGPSREGLRPLCPVPAAGGGATARSPHLQARLVFLGLALRSDTLTPHWGTGCGVLSRCPASGSVDEDSKAPSPSPGPTRPAWASREECRQSCTLRPHSPTSPRPARRCPPPPPQRAGKQTGRTSREQGGALTGGSWRPRPWIRQRKVQNS